MGIRKRLLIPGLILIGLINFDLIAYGQNYQTADEIKEQKKQNEYKEKSAIVGKKIWIYPNPTAGGQPYLKTPFLESPNPISNEFYVSEKTTFKIVEVVHAIHTTAMGYEIKADLYKVIFEDGKIGYLRYAPNIKRCNPSEYDFNTSPMRPGMHNDFERICCNAISSDSFFDEDPAIIWARAEKNRAERKKKNAAWMARGDVKIGMTKKQVLESNWGTPKSRNTTTISGLIREQWIYGGGYLYFDNDILVGIQR